MRFLMTALVCAILCCAQSWGQVTTPNRPQYAGAFIAVGFRQAVNFYDPDTGEFLRHIDLPINTNYTVMALASNPDTRSLWALAVDSTTNVSALYSFSFETNDGNFWTVLLPSSNVGLAYRKDLGVMVYCDAPNCAFFQSGEAFSTIPDAVHTSASDVCAYSNANGTVKIRGLVSPADGRVYLIDDVANKTSSHAYPADVHAGYFITYEPISGFYYVTGVNGTIAREAPLPGGAVSSNSTPLATGIVNRILSYSGGPGNVTLWVAYPSGVKKFFTKDGTNIFPVGVTLRIFDSTAIAYMPEVAPLNPPTATGSTTSAQFGISPNFGLSSNAGTSATETTRPVYGNFSSAAGTLDFPDVWLKSQDAFENGTGTTLDGLEVLALDNSTTYAYAYTASFDNTTTSPNITVSSLYNPTSPISIKTSDGQLQYTLDGGSIKYSVSIKGANLLNLLFGGDASGVLSWGTCFFNDQKLGSYDLDYVLIAGEDSTTYLFNRGADELRLNVPYKGIADDVLVTIPHSLSPPPVYEDGQIKICVDWKFPSFDRSLFYDPDLSVLTQPRPESDDSTNSHVVAIAVPVVIGGACILCCCIIIGVVIVSAIVTMANKRRRKRTLTESLGAL